MTATLVQADARSDYLIRLLTTSSAFRVRVQAAMSLGRVEPSREVVEALTNALRDGHASVRAAAATSLGQLGDASALGALRRARTDSDSAVRSSIDQAIAALERAGASGPRTRPVEGEHPRPTGPVRYYVGVAMPSSAAPGITAALREQARDFIKGQLEQMGGMLIAPERESAAAARRTLSQRRLRGYEIATSIVSVENRGGGTRVAVSVMVNTYPGREMRVILQGAATVPGATGPSAIQQALEGALTGALRRVPQAFEASDGRGS